MLKSLTSVLLTSVLTTPTSAMSMSTAMCTIIAACFLQRYEEKQWRSDKSESTLDLKQPDLLDSFDGNPRLFNTR